MPTEAELVEHYDSNLNYASIGFENLMRLIGAFKLNLRRINTVLDLGCGDGRYTEFLSDILRVTAYGVDYSPARIKKAEELKHYDTNYHCSDIRDSEWEGDLTLMIEVLEHLQNPVEVVQHALKYTKVYMLATVPLNMPYKAHLSVYKSPEEVMKLFQPTQAAVFPTTDTQLHVAMLWEK